MYVSLFRVLYNYMGHNGASGSLVVLAFLEIDLPPGSTCFVKSFGSMHLPSCLQSYTYMKTLAFLSPVTINPTPVEKGYRKLL